MACALFLLPPQEAMSEAKQPRLYAAASAPDICARLRHTIEAIETARIVIDQTTGADGAPLRLHLDQIENDLQQLIADIECRAR
jgi:hypothetical protein